MLRKDVCNVLCKAFQNDNLSFVLLCISLFVFANAQFSRVPITDCVATFVFLSSFNILHFSILLFSSFSFLTLYSFDARRLVDFSVCKVQSLTMSSFICFVIKLRSLKNVATDECVFFFHCHRLFFYVSILTFSLSLLSLLPAFLLPSGGCLCFPWFFTLTFSFP